MLLLDLHLYTYFYMSECSLCMSIDLYLVYDVTGHTSLPKPFALKMYKNDLHASTYVDVKIK